MANEFKDALEEMLDLAGVPLNEADDEEENDTEDQGASGDEAGTSGGEGSNASDEELQDKWEKTISSAGTFKIEWTDNYVWVWYKNKRSQKIPIPPKLKPQRNRISSFLDKILSHVEEMS